MPDATNSVIPAGWMIVPIEPTWEMQVAARDAVPFDDPDYGLSSSDVRAAYSAMLAAAPEPPVAVRPDVMGKLVEALEPFASFEDSSVWEPTVYKDRSDDTPVLVSEPTGKRVTLGDFRRAAAVLALVKGGQP